MKITARLFWGALVCFASGPLHAQGVINDLPRNETLIAENPEAP